MRALDMKPYPDAIKLEALKRAAQPGMSVAQVEQDLGIKRGRIYEWRRRYRIDESSGDLMPATEREKAAEIRRLKRELTAVRQEINILRAAAGFFSEADSP